MPADEPAPSPRGARQEAQAALRKHFVDVYDHAKVSHGVMCSILRPRERFGAGVGSASGGSAESSDFAKNIARLRVMERALDSVVRPAVGLFIFFYSCLVH